MQRWAFQWQWKKNGRSSVDGNATGYRTGLKSYAVEIAPGEADEAARAGGEMEEEEDVHKVRPAVIGRSPEPCLQSDQAWAVIFMRGIWITVSIP